MRSVSIEQWWMTVYMLGMPSVSTGTFVELTWRSWVPNLIDMVVIGNELLRGIRSDNDVMLLASDAA